MSVLCRQECLRTPARRLGTVRNHLVSSRNGLCSRRALARGRKWSVSARDPSPVALLTAGWYRIGPKSTPWVTDLEGDDPGVADVRA